METSILEELRPEIENRIRNLFWTVSGDYSLDIQPDAEAFLRSKPMALYDAIKQGAFARFFDGRELALYTMKKTASGADQEALLEITRLCADAAAYPKIAAERRGIDEIRQNAFSDALRDESGDTPLSRLRMAVMGRFLGRESLPQADETAVQTVEGLSRAENTAQIIAAIDSLYNRMIDPEFDKKSGNLSKILAMSEEELYEYQRFQELSDERRKTVLDEYAEALKTEMLRIQKKPVHRRFQPVLDTAPEDEEPTPEAAEKVRAFIERSFGKSCLTPQEQSKRTRQLCKGLHSRCTLYFTSGILQNPAIKNTQYLRGEMQKMKNEIYFNMKQLPIRRNVEVLSAMLKRVQVMRLDEDSAKSDSGALIPSRLWKVGRTSDVKLFDEKKKREDSAFVVDILIDSSSSQIVRQPQIAAQSYIISQALTQAGIPHRVSSFCSYWDYTIVHRFRDYDDPEAENKNILQFHAFGENRDGLAIATVCARLQQRREENKILIILSDGRPNNLGFSRAGSRKVLPYVGEEAVKDTAFQVRKARNLGIHVLGIFVGSEEDLAVEKRIFGKEFTYTKNISSFSHIVGRYLRKLMES